MDFSDHPRLYCSSSKDTVIINHSPFTIGRGVNCHYIVPNQVVSRLHCQIEKTGNQWVLRDKSTNGTFLNGALIKLNISPPLKDADEIKLCDDSYKYIFQYKCASKDDISDEQLCRIADSVLQNLEVSPASVSNNSVIPINIVSSAPTSYSSSVIGVQPKKKIKVTPGLFSSSVIDLTNESINYANEAPSTSNGSEPPVIDLCDSFLLPTTADSKMVIQELSNVKDKPEVRCDVASTSSTAMLMSRAESDQLKEKQFSDEIENQEELLCAICSEMFVKATTLNCSHTFCKACIDTWKKKQKLCPICRTKIVSQVGTLVLDNFIEKIIQNSTQDVREHRKELLEERKKSDQINQKPIMKAAPSFHEEDTGDTTLSDTSDSEEDDILNLDLHDDWAYSIPYYRGYGNCFSCGRRGHWANGCPFR